MKRVYKWDTYHDGPNRLIVGRQYLDAMTREMLELLLDGSTRAFGRLLRRILRRRAV